MKCLFSFFILIFLSFSAEFDAEYGREAGLGITNYREYLAAIGEDYDEIMAEVRRIVEENMPKWKLIHAAKNGNFPEVVRLVDEEHVDVNSENCVSFPFKKRNLNHLFLFFVCE